MEKAKHLREKLKEEIEKTDSEDDVELETTSEDSSSSTSEEEEKVEVKKKRKKKHHTKTIIGRTVQSRLKVRGRDQVLEDIKTSRKEI